MWLSWKNRVIVPLKIHGILNFLPFGTGSIIAKNSGTDDEVVVQLKNVRRLSDKVHRQFIRVLFDPLNATLICIVYAWNCQSWCNSDWNLLKLLCFSSCLLYRKLYKQLDTRKV